MVSQIVLFMSVIVVVIVLAIIYKNYVATTDLSLKQKHEQVKETFETSFEILNSSYSEDTITAYLKNTGSVKLDPGEVDLFVNNDRIPRNSTDKNITLVEDYNPINKQHWDPSEILKVNISYTLNNNSILRISSENGISESTIIEV